MSLGFREDRRRRRRRTQLLLFKWFAACCFVIATGTYAYQMGKRLASAEIGRLRDQVETMTARIHELETLTAAQRAEIGGAEATARNWQTLYERDVAQGSTKELLALLQQKLATGVEVDRLKTVIDATQNRRDCRREAERRKFQLPTDAKEAPNASLKFVNGEVKIVAFGAPARDQNGNEESWFDAAEPVTARIIRDGSIVTEVTGALPLAPGQIVGGREYRFAIEPSKLRGRVDILAESCRFP